MFDNNTKIKRIGSYDYSISGNSKDSPVGDRLEQDIRSRGLRYGNRYLTVLEAGHLLGVSKTTADRAMRILTGSENENDAHLEGRHVGDDRSENGGAPREGAWDQLQQELAQRVVRRSSKRKQREGPSRPKVLTTQTA